MTTPIAQGSADVNVRGVITHGGSDRGYKLCRCHKCGHESICTPTNDFYTTSSDDEPLMCEKCFRDYVKVWKAPNALGNRLPATGAAKEGEEG